MLEQEIVPHKFQILFQSHSLHLKLSMSAASKLHHGWHFATHLLSSLKLLFQKLFLSFLSQTTHLAGAKSSLDFPSTFLLVVVVVLEGSFRCRFSHTRSSSSSSSSWLRVVVLFHPDEREHWARPQSQRAGESVCVCVHVATVNGYENFQPCTYLVLI